MFLDEKQSKRLGDIILEPKIQTRIASFLIGIKQYNCMVLSKFEWQPVEWIPYALLHGQLYREMELIGLLRHTCSWSLDPGVYVQTSKTQMQVYTDLKFSDYLFTPAEADLTFYRYLALSQGLFAHLRFIRLLPVELPIEHKFLVLLRSLETVHGQQMQGQIQMLRHFPVDLSESARERIVGEESRRVLRVFENFVQELLQEEPS
ncbi:MAG: hypothetical protein BWY57_00015 [Betaproteobacteria bacterium ADurb.Bin341]|nr:MAG: hypothetical protein BWY57_00015 [Betaproteobacteria bacterium ADurb.Bin341]